MSRADFFEAKGAKWEESLCRAVEEAWKAGGRIYVWAASEAHAREIDDLLWTFRDDSFVPHALWQGEAGVEDPVAVGWRPGNPNGATCVALARDASAEELRGYDRVLDFAPMDVPQLKELARRRYVALREAGFAVSFHSSP